MLYHALISLSIRMLYGLSGYLTYCYVNSIVEGNRFSGIVL